MTLSSRRKTRSTRPRASGAGSRSLVVSLFVLLLIGWTISLSAQEAPSPITLPADAVADPAPGPAGEPVPAAPRGLPKHPVQILLSLGYFLYPLALTSIVVFWFSMERLVALRRGRVIPRPFVKRFFEHMEQGNLDPQTALELCEENGSPIAKVFAHGLRKWGKPSVEVEQAIIDGGERQMSHLRKHIRVLNGAATVAPLLGLLGTVAGMIDSFNAVAQKQAMGRTEDLAAGIGLALLTTAAGLIIAIPSLVMYMYLGGRVDALVIEMDQLSQELVDLISAEGLQEARTRPAAKAAPEGKKAAAT